MSPPTTPPDDRPHVDVGAPGGRELAQALLSRERASAEGAGDCIPAVQRVVDRLHESLSLWFGEDGFDALLTRALDRARATHDALQEVRRESRGVLEFGGLTERLRGRPATEVNEIVLTFLETFVTLLGRMLGSDLAGRLIEQSWISDPTQAPAAASESSSKKRSNL